MAEPTPSWVQAMATLTVTLIRQGLHPHALKCQSHRQHSECHSQPAPGSCIALCSSAWRHQKLQQMHVRLRLQPDTT